VLCLTECVSRVSKFVGGRKIVEVPAAVREFFPLGCKVVIRKVEDCRMFAEEGKGGGSE